MSTAFLLTSLVVVVSPGTGVLYTMAAGLSRGARASVIAAVGCSLGIIPHMIAAITGLAALLHTSAVAFQTLKYVGVTYLLFIGWRTLKEKGTLTVENETGPPLRDERDCLRHSGQHTQSETVDILLRVSTAVRERQRSECARPNGGVERCFHVVDARHLRRLWEFCGRASEARHIPTSGIDLDAPRLRRRICRPRREAGVRRSVTATR